MATLTRARESIEEQPCSDILVNSHVPSPFPVHLLGTVDSLGDAPRDVELEADPFVDQEVQLDGEGLENETLPELQRIEGAVSKELLPSLGQVQQSCLMTLNNLLSGPFEDSATWHPILPPRRHSMPSRPGDSSQSNEPSSALQTLLSNLRNRDSGQMSQVSSSTADTSELLAELRRRVDSISHELPPSDARLSRALVSLLAHVDQLAVIDPRLMDSGSQASHVDLGTMHTEQDIYDQLSRQVADLQIQRLDQGQISSLADSPQRQVELALLWSKIDHELEDVSHLCRSRDEFAPLPYSAGPEQLPPEYTIHGDEEHSLPPEYDYPWQSYADEKKGLSTQHSQTESLSEKRRMDFEAVTMAIDRLYLVAPQLHSQRVELRKSKLDEMERAKQASPSQPQREKGKGKQKDVRELERIIELVDKASSRRLDNQTVVIGSGMQGRIERAQQREKAKRDAFVEQLASHSDVRRIASQDAVFQAGREKSADTMLTLPEFMREQVPLELQQSAVLDPDALLSLSDIVKEMPPPKTATPIITPKSSSDSIKSPKKRRGTESSVIGNRSRSISAPPLSWLIPSLSRNRSSASLRALANISTETSDGGTKRLAVRYVAELHENLGHVLLFVGVDEGLHPGSDVECHVLPSVGDPNIGDKFRLKCGSAISTIYSLPVKVKSGNADVQAQLKHYEVKFPLAPTPRPSTVSTPQILEDSRRMSEDDSEYLLQASQIASMDPTSFICASCSSSLVQTQGGLDNEKFTYQDLPSEHWAELLEAWMCHPDQKVTEHIAQYSKGIWPKKWQAFVGGSYFLFDGSSVVRTNLKVVSSGKNDDWERVQCICGSVVGRCQEYEATEGTISTVFRFPKYTIRPVSLNSEHVRIPLSAFILEDMHEFVRAHATYRFVILDEEEERPRLLIWLFKPNMRLSYATTAQFVLPQTGTVRASKVLFKVLQAGESTPPLGSGSGPQFDLDRILQKHPGFPQAERLMYPRGICERLVALLRESNTAYPFGTRVMTGLLTGWLRKN